MLLVELNLQFEENMEEKKVLLILSGKELANSMPEEILNIKLGTDTSDATATASNIQAGYTAYSNREKLFGVL